MAAATEALQALPYFAALTVDKLALVRELALERSYQQGEIIFLEGGPCEGVFIVQSGRVKIYKTAPSGREYALQVIGPGGWFNAVPVFDGGPNPASALALEPVRVYVIPRADMLRLAQHYPEVAMAVIHIFARRLRYLTNVIEDLAFLHVTARVAKQLLAEHEASGGRREVRLTQQELALRVGTAREVVGRVLRLLAEARAIRVRRGVIEIVDRSILELHIDSS
jgi:CRP/FNR family cyclic AMP-dependent transcriptional regulator